MAAQILTSAPSVCRNMIRARDFNCVDELRAHYAAVHARIWGARRPQVADEPNPTMPPPVAMAQPNDATQPRSDAEPNPVVATIAETARGERPAEIIHRVAVAHGATFEDLLGHVRTRRLIQARRAAMAALLEARPQASLSQIGRWIGKDHSTVLHGLRAMGLSVEGSADRLRARTTGAEPAEPAPPVPTPRSVIAGVARRHGFLVRDIVGWGRAPALEHARQEAIIAVSDAFPAMATAAVADLFGRERSTVAHARRRHAERCAATLSQPKETQP